MSERSERTPFQQALRDELLEAARRGPRRRRWPWAAAAGAIAAGAGSLLVLDTNPATADVEVHFEAGSVEVLMTDSRTSVAEVREVLAEAGIRVRIDEQPAGPSNVGRFVGVLIDGPGQQVTNVGGPSGTSFSSFTVDDDWQGTLVISLGRTARPGEVYVVSSDAFADGEPLDCSGVLGRSLAESADELAGFHVRISPSAEGYLVPPEALDAAAIDRYGSWIVTRGSALSPTDVILTLQPTAPVPPPAEDDC